MGSTSNANDFGVDKEPTADAGKEASVTLQPGGDDDDDTTPVDAGKTDSGKDSGGQTGACSFTGTLATWDLSALSGSTGQVNATSTANGVSGAR